MKSKSLMERLVPRLFEDDRFLAVEKPAGIDVGGMAEKGVTGLVELLGDSAGGKTLHVVNRLSRYESGVLLLAKDAASAAFVRHALKAGRVEQEYTAIVIGRMREPRMTLGAGDVERRGLRREKPKARVGNPRSSPIPTATLTGRSGVAGAGISTTLIRLRESERRTLVGCRTTAANTHALRAMLRGARLRLLGDNVHDASRRRQSNASTRLHLAKFSFHHPGLRTRVGVTSRASESFASPVTGEADIDRPLRAALVRRASILDDPEVDCLRLLTGDREDFAGLNVERYGDVLILQVLDERAGDRAKLMGVVKWYREHFGIWSAYVKRFVKERVKEVGRSETVAADPSRPLWGERVREHVEVRERGLRFAVRPGEGLNVGLFLDQRDNRARVRGMAGGKDVLNLFAYTCGFSVAAAAGGAKCAVSVDISPKHLEWGRENFSLNGLNPSDHLFIRSDAADYLRRAKRQGRSFDLIVLDPPSFAHGRKSGGDFSIADDLTGLVSACAEVLRPGGSMMVSTNYRRMPLSGLKERVLRGCSGRPCRITSTPPLPVDFAVDRDHARTLFLRLDD